MKTVVMPILHIIIDIIHDIFVSTSVAYDVFIITRLPCETDSCTADIAFHTTFQTTYYYRQTGVVMKILLVGSIMATLAQAA